MPPDEAAETPHVPREGPQEESCISVSLLSPEDLRPPMSQPTFSPTFERIRAVEVLPTSTSSPVQTARGEWAYHNCPFAQVIEPRILTPTAIAPESALSSSETFGSEIKTLLVSRSNPGSAASPSTNTGVTPLPHIDRRGLLEAIGPWPTEEEAHAMLDTVVFNVGISQQLFDVRAFSDNLAVLYQETSANVRLTEIWIVEALLVFAVGRLLQSRDDENGDLPGTRFFQEAVKRTPLLSDLRKHGIVGVEVMALTALYLQISDRKDDAYLHVSCRNIGLHRSNY